MTGQRDGRSVRWQDHNRERRQQIIAAAIGVVEDHEPGAHVPVQQIAERAGMTRSVLYRHFKDRVDLDRAVRGAIVDALSEELLPAVTLDGTVPDIIERVISRYVAWAVAHPSLHRLAESDPLGVPEGPLQRGLERIAEQVAELVGTAVDMLGAPLQEEQRAVVDPLAFGLVGAVFSAVRRWLAGAERTPSAPLLVAALTDSVWYLLQGHARVLGVRLEGDQPLQELLAEASGT